MLTSTSMMTAPEKEFVSSLALTPRLTSVSPENRLSITILIPCHNEEKSIAATITSCLSQTRPADKILVVNDGSTDTTGLILSSFGDKIEVITIPVATGNKSHAQEAGLKYIDTDIFIATDGDTILHENFVEHMVADFIDPTVVASGVYVKSLPHNWLTACRELDYILGQDLYKVSQAYLNAVYVIPGCAGAFRTGKFKEHLKFEHDTLTEDLDFTYRLHKKDLKIVYDRRAVVYTQDPATIFEYVKQMRRWYAGGWQNLLKHYQIFNRPANAFQLSLIYIEGLFSSLLLLVTPFISIKIFLFMLIPNFVFFILLGIYGAITRRRLGLFLVSPLCMVILFINSWVFIEQFIQEIVLRRKNLVWFTPSRRAIAAKHI